MKAATLLIIALTHQGFWFGGHAQTLTVRPAVPGLPASELRWELRFAGERLSKGVVSLSGEDKPTTIELAIPPARVRNTLHWSFRLVEKASGKELDSGDTVITAFPQTLLEGLAERVGRKRIVIWDDSAGLPKIFDDAHAPYLRVDSSTKLVLSQADVVLVGNDVISDSPFEQGPLVDLARSGASVMLFRQARPAALIGYRLAVRDTPPRLEWRAEHPLLSGFEPTDLQSLVAGSSSVHVVQLPSDEPALELGYVSREVSGDEPAPIDAVLLTKTIGKGRVVLCQLPLGPWDSDPRSQILLANSIDYLLTRPQPTPAPSQRPTTKPSEPRLVPTIDFSPRS